MSVPTLEGDDRMSTFGTRWIVGVVATAVAVGLAGAVAWATWADPGTWVVVEGGLTMNEPGSRGQFGTVVTFVLVGLIAGLLLGLIAVVTSPRLGWTMTLIVGLLAVVASLIAWRLGVVIGPPDPTAVRDLSIGDSVPAELVVDTWVAFLAWPIGAMAGVLAGSGFSRIPD